jgi:glutamyl-tRNA synthetase
MSEVRVRFAPSPTGLLHIGGARTALFNWLYARHTGGKFILRIEDTDAARNTPEAVAVIFQGLRWLGLNWDEGAQEGGGSTGEFGPYYQSQRSALYQKYAEQLLAKNKAYRDDDGTIRFRMPRTPGVVKDLICGDITFDRTMEPDPTIIRKDGSPIFHFVNVIDDLEMKITHVIRGEDHLSNTHKHIALFEALEAAPPQYAHIPLILNSNGSKMSKRDQGASVTEYIEQGYLPEALRNYLCLLGWSPKDNREIISIEEVIEKFDLPQVNRSNARFDLNKLFWINGEYFRALTVEQLEAFASPLLQKAGVLPATYDPAYLRAALAIVKEKVKIGRELPEWLGYFFTEEFPFDPATVAKVFTPAGQENLRVLRKNLAEASEFDAAALEGRFKTLAAASGQKVGAYIHPSRLAVSGRSVGPSLYHLLEVLGQERVLARMDRALKLETA